MLTGVGSLSESNPNLTVATTSVLGWLARLGGPEGIDGEERDIQVTDVDGHVTVIGSYTGAKYPPFSANTLGGYVTPIPSSVFNKGVGAWYNVSVEISPTQARCFVDDILVAVHTTHIPFFGHPYYAFEFVGVVSTWHPASTAHASVIDVDSYAVGRVTKLVTVDASTSLDSPSLHHFIPIVPWKDFRPDSQG
jgi:hypothetical protein